MAPASHIHAPDHHHTDDPLSSFLAHGSGLAVRNASIKAPFSVASAVECAAHCLAFNNSKTSKAGAPGLLRNQCIAFNLLSTTSNNNPTTAKALTCELCGWSQTYAVDDTASADSTYFFRKLPNDQTTVQPAVAYAMDLASNGAVRLLPGLFHNATLRNANYLSGYQVDDMLYWFRVRAGNPSPPGQSWGWDNGGPDRPYGLRGSVAGTFLMGAGNHLRWTANSTLAAKVEQVVAGIRAARADNGYIAAFPLNESYFRENPDYVLSWLTHGLLAAADAGNTDALPLLRGHFDWFNTAEQLASFLPPSGGADVPGQPWAPVSAQTTHGHQIYLIYQGLIHNTRLALSKVGVVQDVRVVTDLYQEDWWLAQLAARNLSAIWQRHWNPHNYEATALEAYMDLYVITGDARYLAAVDGFWEMFRAHWIHVGGSVAIKERKLYPPGSYYLDVTGEDPKCQVSKVCHSTGELCGNAFWILLNQRLHRLRPQQEAYAMEIERSLLNAVISQITPDGTGIRQFAILHKVKMPASNISTCCEGQGTRILGAMHEFVFTANSSSISVDLYASAVGTFAVGATPSLVQLTVQTNWPQAEAVSLSVHLSGGGSSSADFVLQLRIPSWLPAGQPVPVVLQPAGGGSPQQLSGTPGTYLPIRRSWADGDRLSLNLTMRLRASVYTGVDQLPPFRRYAVEYGPVLLGACGPWNATIGSIHVRGVDGSADPASWLRPVAGAPLHFAVENNPSIVYKPYYEIQDEIFEAYPVFDK